MRDWEQWEWVQGHRLSRKADMLFNPHETYGVLGVRASIL